MALEPSEVSRELEAVRSDEEFSARASALAEGWAAAGAGLEFVEPVLRFMEAHPDLDYGMPGGLVHFVERFYRRGYEQILLDSLSRRPTWITTWMLNRLINGTDDESLCHQYSQAMEGAAAHTLADQRTREQARRFIGESEA